MEFDVFKDDDVRVGGREDGGGSDGGGGVQTKTEWSNHIAYPIDLQNH